MPKKAKKTFSMGYDTESETPEAASYFQFIIGILRWMMELGRIYIIIIVIIVITSGNAQ